MSDYYIRHFYDQVKGPSWPEIKNYNDFLNLPDWIKDECNTVHQFPTRLRQLESASYWRENQQHAIGYQYNDLVYVPVLKCANSYYVNFFKDQLGWKEINLDNLNYNEISAFGLMMNPMTRRVKGITQVLFLSYDNDYNRIIELLHTTSFINFISYITILDSHTLPYTVAFGESLNKIHWIPMEPFTDNELKEQITCFLNTKGVDVKIPNTDRINQSSLKKLQVFELIQDIFLTNEPGAELGMFFADDVKFYNNLLKTYATLHNHN
jgi:hypothetical protein